MEDLECNSSVSSRENSSSISVYESYCGLLVPHHLEFSHPLSNNGTYVCPSPDKKSEKKELGRI